MATRLFNIEQKGEWVRDVVLSHDICLVPDSFPLGMPHCGNRSTLFPYLGWAEEANRKAKGAASVCCHLNSHTTHEGGIEENRA